MVPETAGKLFLESFGVKPAGLWSAPGRVNLIGEHTDYSGGLVLPFAIDARAQVALGESTSGLTEVVSAQRDEPLRAFADDQLAPGAAATKGWQAYPLGVIWAMRERGIEVPPLRLALDSAVPAGAGLSSSAAIECAVALAISDHLGLGLTRATIARIAQRAENEYVGVPCGLMDQMASAASIEGHALYFDAREGMTEHIPLRIAEAGLTLLAIDTRVHHRLADGEYAKRRAETEEAASILGVSLLSEVLFANLDWALGRLAGSETLVRRARHVITENQRVRETVALLKAGYVEAIGEALSASHESLRDDFEVSCAELDLAAETAEAAGALGARMVGGGFGGSVIALLPAELTGPVADRVLRAFAGAGCRAPAIRKVSPAPGAHRDA